jgi:hypothetical protein
MYACMPPGDCYILLASDVLDYTGRGVQNLIICVGVRGEADGEVKV